MSNLFFARYCNWVALLRTRLNVKIRNSYSVRQFESLRNSLRDKHLENKEELESAFRDCFLQEMPLSNARI